MNAAVAIAWEVEMSVEERVAKIESDMEAETAALRTDMEKGFASIKVAMADAKTETAKEFGAVRTAMAEVPAAIERAKLWLILAVIGGFGSIVVVALKLFLK